jgi:hypothetical protein
MSRIFPISPLILAEKRAHGSATKLNSLKPILGDPEGLVIPSPSPELELELELVLAPI